MNVTLHSLLARGDMASGLDKYIEDSASLTQHGWMIGGTVFVALAWFIYPIVKRRQKETQLAATKAAAPPPRSVFVELCDRHKLDADERQLMETAARESSLESPAVLFVDPSGLLGLARSQPDQATQCDALIRRLFAEVEPAGV